MNALPECGSISKFHFSKSTSLESRISAWRWLWEQYSISTLSLPLPELWRNLPLWSLWDSCWGPGGKGHEAVRASIRFWSQKFFILSWAQIQLPEILQLSFNRSYQLIIPMASAQLSSFLLLCLSGWTRFSRLESGFALSLCFSDASQKSCWFPVCPNCYCCWDKNNDIQVLQLHIRTETRSPHYVFT